MGEFFTFQQERDLQLSIREETQAIGNYKLRAATARQGGNQPLAAKYDEIRQEEEHHLQELNAALSRLSRR